MLPGYVVAPSNRASVDCDLCAQANGAQSVCAGIDLWRGEGGPGTKYEVPAILSVLCRGQTMHQGKYIRSTYLRTVMPAHDHVTRYE